MISDRDILYQFDEIANQNQQRRTSNLMEAFLTNPMFLFGGALQNAPINEDSPIQCRSM